jgi:hypothetical protein
MKNIVILILFSQSILSQGGLFSDLNATVIFFDDDNNGTVEAFPNGENSDRIVFRI